MRHNRKFVLMAIVAFSAVANAQVWEKQVAPGLTYRMEVDKATPRITHVLRYSPTSNQVKLLPELAGKTVYEPNPSKGRETLSSLVQNTGAIGGINGDYFPYTGSPLGLMMRDGELITVPFKQRSAMAWGLGNATIAIPKFEGTLTPEGGEPIPLTACNRQCGINEVVLNTVTAGMAIAKTPNVLAVIRMGDDFKWNPLETYTGELQYLLTDSEQAPVQPGNILVAAQGTKAQLLATLRPGQRVTLQLQTSGFDWTKQQNVIGGGPCLVRDGKICVSWQEEAFAGTIALRRHSRTAVGRTVNGDLLLVVVDGRSKISTGATLDELAAIMQRLGCVDAMNLDGGGSTTMNLRGLTLNRPSDGVEREIANGLLLMPSDTTAPALISPNPLTIETPSNPPVGDLQLTVKDSAGATIPASEVLWSAQGSGWIDQGGCLHGLSEGTAKVKVFARGAYGEGEVTFVTAPLASRKGAPRGQKRTGKAPKPAEKKP